MLESDLDKVKSFLKLWMPEQGRKNVLLFQDELLVDLRAVISRKLKGLSKFHSADQFKLFFGHWEKKVWGFENMAVSMLRYQLADGEK